MLIKKTFLEIKFPKQTVEIRLFIKLDFIKVFFSVCKCETKGVFKEVSGIRMETQIDEYDL